MVEINFLEVNSISQFRPNPYNSVGMNRMRKKALIVVSLVDESAEKANEEIEKEILEELSEHLPRIPWCKEVERVTVKEV